MAAYEGQQSTFGELTASADLSSKQYYFVKLSSATAGTDTTVYVCGQAIGAASAGQTFTAFINITNSRAA